ncbi:acetyltransferase, ribosomal protein N-acetylase [Bernardetia litoralis DSM 6794]|uniref:Acetyltransferase, ribosomal protein N-acetylase n=1 Tax=Bernardetia litoralis (strain ATCC 23117 / DSM 6794 / NBRC 15988 / NCIMB 1366 / Fx l1 / Sio-4) TaxID=880071 RepID=I4APP4_BERLS|nr:GNAT family N-acetyltransferase [Bernardetia litoralis]AFM05929.1 acetyltransferase, ribosomal protein N-acetylase [Bernardetia litoralis DSM 6794]
MNNKYILKSKHLGFRNWNFCDTDKLFALNSDKEVMEFFPHLPSLEQTKEFIKRMQNQFEKNGFCYFAVDFLETEEFIGFIGIIEQTYEADFTPCVDIGWRLDKKYWNKGYASEGAKRCLEFAFEDKKLESIKAIAPEINLKSRKVMEKIGMKYVKDFKHPALINDKKLETCVLYEINKEYFSQEKL